MPSLLASLSAAPSAGSQEKEISHCFLDLVCKENGLGIGCRCYRPSGLRHRASHGKTYGSCAALLWELEVEPWEDARGGEFITKNSKISGDFCMGRNLGDGQEPGRKIGDQETTHTVSIL